MTDHSIETRDDAPARNQWWDVWDQFKTHKGAVMGAAFFIFIILAVYIGPYIWTIDPTYIDVRARNQGPTWTHPFGTDQLGRDMLARMMAGGRRQSLSGSRRWALRCSLGHLLACSLDISNASTGC